MGAYTEILDFTFTANETSRTFSGLSITKDDFVKVVVTFVNASGSNSDIRLLANSSTNGNYHTQLLQGNDTSVSASRGNFNVIGRNQGSTTSTTLIYAKLSQNDRFNIFSNNNRGNDSGVAVAFRYTTSSGATFTSGITSLTLTSEISSAIGTGSRIQIYKLAAEKVADITVTSNTTQVDISNLSIDKDSEYLLVSDYIDISSGAALFIYPNDLTTNADYYSQVIRGFGSTTSANRYNRPEFFDNLGTSARNISYSHIKLSNIGAFTVQNYAMQQYGTTTPRLLNYFISSTSESITSITKLNFIASQTNGIGAGSRFELYKLYE